MANTCIADLVCYLAFVYFPQPYLSGHALARIDSCDSGRFSECFGQHANEAGFVGSWISLVMVVDILCDFTRMVLAGTVVCGTAGLSGSFMEGCPLISNPITGAHQTSSQSAIESRLNRI